MPFLQQGTQCNALQDVTGGTGTYPRPSARMCEMSKEGMNTLRNSAEKMPPSFMTPLFLILRDTERRGCLKWNSLSRRVNEMNANMFHNITDEDIKTCCDQ